MSILAKYANLLVNYCLEISQGDRLFVRTTTLAEPLVREIYRSCLRAGGHMEVQFSFREQHRILNQIGNSDQLSYIDHGYQNAMKNFDAYLFIRAPYNLKEDQNNDPSKTAIRRKALKPISDIYFERTADRSLRRSLCQFPTQANAQEADMSLEEYQDFVYSACKLYEDDPIQAWRDLGCNQQAIVDMLNTKKKLRYKNAKTDITFSVAGRTWINSDGKTNMPSGEVFSGPVEDSVNGTVYFDYPSIYMGKDVRGITLKVLNGEVVEWKAEQGQDILDAVFDVDGARFFGEVAIGTNYGIQRPSKNILFDEKIGGTIHMAVGQSYKQTGGKNDSSIHWDMIASMKEGGQIFADDELIYENGRFLDYKV
jgi:aminopeptidase